MNALFTRLLTLAVVLATALTASAQVTVLDEQLRDGTLPAGWSQTDVTFSTGSGGYANVTGTTGVLTTPVLDLTAYDSVELTFSVAKFGTGTDGPITVEISDDGGATFTAQTFDSPTPTSSTYLTSGPTAITSLTATVVIRFTAANSASAKRLRDVIVLGTIAGAIEGCTNPSACNYDASATIDNSTCVLVGDACDDGDANTIDDVVQGDCSCAGVLPTFDCPVESANFGDACNDGDANTVGDVVQNDCSCAGFVPDLSGCTLFFSEYGEGTSNNKYFEIYNPTDAAISLDGYAFPSVSNDPTVVGEYEFWNPFPAGATIAAGDVYVVAHGSADPAILAEADHTFNFLSNGDDGFALVIGTETSYLVIDWLGNWDGDPGSGWAVAGVANATVDAVLVRKSDINSGNNDWFASAGTDATDSEWIVLANEDWSNLGQHTFTGSCGAPVFDCPVEEANFGDPCDDGDANTTGDIIQGDCSCAGVAPTFDCPVEEANFGDPCDDGDANTTDDVVQNDCSCAGTPIAAGCTPFYTEDFEVDGAGTTYFLNTSNGQQFTDGVGDFFTQVPSSTIATSYVVTGQNGTGYFAAMDTNGDGEASILTLTIEDIDITGQTGLELSLLAAEDDDGPTNQDWDATSLVIVQIDIDNTGIFTPIIQFASGGATNTEPGLDANLDGVWDGVEGPALSEAFQSFSAAIAGTGSTLDIQIVFQNLDDGDEDIAIDFIQVCSGGAGDISGCTDMAACNFNPDATVDNGSCLIIGQACDDLDISTENDIVTAACECAGTPVPVPALVINEIHYNPCTAQGNDDLFEFVEIFNAEATAIDLSNYFFSAGIDFTFPVGASIAAGEYIIVTINPANYTGNGYQVFGPFVGALGNSGENVALSDPLGIVVDEVNYGTGGAWPGAANGGCSSLELIDASTDNSDPANWQASWVQDGTPGAANSLPPVGTNFTIFEIQSDLDVATGASNLEGQTVITQGIVTGVYDGLFSMQDGTGPFSGIWVSGTGVQIGDEVEVTGQISEQFGLTRIVLVSNISIQSQGNPLPANQSLFTTGINDEQWEGVLVEVTGIATSVVDGNGEWTLDDNSGNARVDDLGFLASIDVDVQYTVIGPNYFSFGFFKLAPRDGNDVLRWGCTTDTFLNFDPLAVIDDGSCSNVTGCTNPNADNFDPLAVEDDGSCFIAGCTDPSALNFDADATTDDGSCFFTLPNVVINEIHYNPCTLQGNNLDSDFEFEFFELVNIDAVAHDISGWVISGSTGFTFPEGSSIAAGEYIVLAIAAATYEGNGYQVFEWTTGNLGNGGGIITLTDPFANVIDEVGYQDVAPWPFTPDGGCVSLELIDPTLDNSDGANWQGSFVLYGTPGAENSQNISGCTNPLACNFNPAATNDDGTCDLTSCLGCTYEDADNFTPGATVDDGSCLFTLGSPCPADLNGDALINASDLSLFLAAFGTFCN